MPHHLVVNIKYQKADIYCGRPSVFGNPFIIGRDGTREQVIDKHYKWLMTQPKLIVRIKRELSNKTLGCFCAPLKCHCDILAIIANTKD